MIAKTNLSITSLGLALLLMGGTSATYGQCPDVTIGGAVYSGTGTVTFSVDALGEPVIHRNPVLAPAAPALTPAANNVQVMIQDMDGGAVVAYGTFAAGTNAWSACVPAGSTYIAMFSATDHDLTSRVFDAREFVLDATGGTIPNPAFPPAAVDAYLPALYLNLDTGVVDPAAEPIEPLGNLLVYGFQENQVNGAPDGDDPGLPGVLMELYDPRTGVVVKSGTTMEGSNDPTAINTKDGLAIPGIDAAGLLYITDIVPGVYQLRAIPPGHAGNPAPAVDAAGMPWTDGWYHTYTMEGTQEWEILIYPGDPGTEAGAFLAWFGFVKKVGQLAPGTGGTTISGVVEDADVAWETPIAGGEPEPPEAGTPLDAVYRHQGVSTHGLVPNAFLILWRQMGDFSAVIATTDADPVTGAFQIDNVPQGTYNIFLSDTSLHWIFQEVQLDVDGVNDIVFTPFAQEIPGMPLAIMPRFAARVNGFVVDDATGIGIGGATVNLRYQPGNAAFTVVTEPNGWYNFEWLPEIETMAMIDVEPPPGYRGKLVTDTYYPAAFVPPDPNCDTVQFPNCSIVPTPCDPGTAGCVIPGDPVDVQRNGMNRWVQYYTANYKSDLILEPVPAAAGQIQGIVWNDSLALGTWVGDGLYDKVDEAVVEGVTIELLDGMGAVIATTTSGAYDEAVAVAQGYPAGPVPPDEWGGFYSGPMPGFYEFRDVAAGTYTLRLILPDGFYAPGWIASDPGPGPNFIELTNVTVTGGARTDLDIGINTLVPQAGIMEGGVFDDQFLDLRWFSAFSEEKQLLTGIGVNVRDHLGYTLDTMNQPSAVCYPGTTPLDPAVTPAPYGAICDRPDLGQDVEIDRLVAPGLRLYYGNDPALPECTGVDPVTGLPNGTPAVGDPPCHNPNLFILELPYTMGQSLAKYEADWSLPPALTQGGPIVTPCPQAVFISALSGSSAPGEEFKWSATISVTVRDPLGFLAGAEVFASWSTGEESAGLTNENGVATLDLETIDNWTLEWVTAIITVNPPEGVGGVFNPACGVGNCINVNHPGTPGFVLCGVGAPFCGDNVCGIDEDGCNCQEDCGIPVEICDDTLDNDCDGLADCNDLDCAADPACAVAYCGDGTCDADETLCGCPADCGPIPAEICADGIDNDCDGDADCADWDCLIVAPCLPFCGDGICGSGEDQCSCAMDCAAPPVAACVDPDVIISGRVFSGTGTVTYTMDAIGEPVAHRNAVFAADGAPPLTLETNNARVMIQDMDGGAIVGYGTFDAGANTWSACVPTGGSYIAMFSAMGHDLTSRVYDLSDPMIETWILSTDAYLPALHMNIDTAVIDPATEPIQPAGNLLVYGFEENEVNGAADGIDPGLPGVLMELYNPKTGFVVASGTTMEGSNDPTAIQTKDGLVIPGDRAAGLYYFENVPPGEYGLRATPPGHPGNPAPALDAAGDPWTNGWYYTYTMEGGKDWEILIYPGDPGTEAGAFIAWFGFVKKVGTLPAGGGGSSIIGTVEDADIAWEPPMPGNPEPPEAGAPLDPMWRNQGVSVHLIVPDALIILWQRIGDVSTVIATVEPDPVTAQFSIDNVPAGTYNIFLTDKALHWVFGEIQVTVDGVNDVVFPLFINEAPGMPKVVLPRFAARVNGFVVDGVTGIGVSGATVNLRYQGGNAAQSVITDATGWYNFEFLGEIETMAFLDVEPPAGYRGKLVTDTYFPTAHVPLDPLCDPLVFPNCPVIADPCHPATPGCVIVGAPLDVVRNGMGRWVQYYTASYKSDLILEPVPAGVGQIQGIVFNDSLAMGTWVGNGLYDKVEESVAEGATVELLDATGRVIAATTSGTYDPAIAVAQGYIQPGKSVPPDEWGGFFSGPMTGFYEFRDVAPGNYTVRVTPPNGFCANGLSSTDVIVTDGGRLDLDIGLHTGAPRAGTLEGGVFDDIILDHRWYSAFAEEKQLLVGIGVTVRDYLGYQLDTLVQPSAVCYQGTTPLDPTVPPIQGGAICDRPDLGTDVEIDRMVAPGLRLYWGNDPTLPPCNPGNLNSPCFDATLFNLELPYTMGQGLAKFEADWSLPGALVMPFDACGFLIQGAECVLFQDNATGGLHLLDNAGAFGLGDFVHVTGTLDLDCNTICMQGDCLVVNTIAACAAVCGDGVCSGDELWCNCEDDCIPPVNPAETDCADGVDNDCDGDIDCADLDCCDAPGCACVAFCGDGICDPALGEDVCTCAVDCGAPPAEDCADGIDNDCDALVDCIDDDCAADPACGAQDGGVIVTTIDSQGIAMEEGKWRAQVTLYVIDGGGAPVPGVQVVYNFIPGETKSENTDAAGTITVASETYEGGNQATFLVISVDHPDYDEGGSVTNITINRP